MTACGAEESADSCGDEALATSDGFKSLAVDVDDSALPANRLQVKSENVTRMERRRPRGDFTVFP
jgi:hypothetical protein